MKLYNHFSRSSDCSGHRNILLRLLLVLIARFGAMRCTVQLETHKSFCCRRAGEPPKNQPRNTQSVYYSNIAA